MNLDNPRRLARLHGRVQCGRATACHAQRTLSLLYFSFGRPDCMMNVCSAGGETAWHAQRSPCPNYYIYVLGKGGAKIRFPWSSGQGCEPSSPPRQALGSQRSEGTPSPPWSKGDLESLSFARAFCSKMLLFLQPNYSQKLHAP